jgi:arylsulfatase A
MRVPGLAWCPGRIQPSVTSQPVSTMDLFQTSIALSGASLPPDVIIDGRDVSPLLLRGQSLPATPFFYYRGDQLAACRLGEWKAHFFTQSGYGQPNPDQHDPPLLFQLALDPSEKRNVAAEHPDVIARIREAVSAHQAGVVRGEPQLR